MLEEIQIDGLGVIAAATLELDSGLTVLTGETGAGKTMVLTGLGLLMGGRADPGAVRSDCERAVVEGRIRVGQQDAVAARAAEAGAELDEETLIVTRTVSTEGRSRAHIGGRGVPASVLTEIAADLVAVHGQHDQQRLLNPAHQRAALDRYAGTQHQARVDEFADAVQGLRAVESELQQLVDAATDRQRELDLLRRGLAEVERVEPQPGEDVALQEEEERLGHADTLREAASSAHELLAADDPQADGQDITTMLTRAQQALAAQSEHDPALSGLADRLADLGYLAADLASDLASYATGVETDPVRLSAVQDRRAELGGLVRAHGTSVDDVLRWSGEASARVLELDSTDERIEQLRSERDRRRADLAEQALGLSRTRHDTAEAFSAAVTEELHALAMPHARMEVGLTRRPDPDGLLVEEAGQSVAFGSHGIDEIELRFSAHDGAEMRPLGKGASGGERSRLMLAVEVVLAASDPVPTFVFDEVDAGIGGKAAVEVGRRLARLSRHAQVIVVTHLPQVAAFADRHLSVVKDDDGAVVSSGVAALDDAGRVRELSRMLAGLEGSDTARAHAAELLQTAAEAKNAVSPV